MFSFPLPPQNSATVTALTLFSFFFLFFSWEFFDSLDDAMHLNPFELHFQLSDYARFFFLDLLDSRLYSPTLRSGNSQLPCSPSAQPPALSPPCKTSFRQTVQTSFWSDSDFFFSPTSFEWGGKAPPTVSLSLNAQVSSLAGQFSKSFRRPISERIKVDQPSPSLQTYPPPISFANLFVSPFLFVHDRSKQDGRIFVIYSSPLPRKSC